MTRQKEGKRKRVHKDDEPQLAYGREENRGCPVEGTDGACPCPGSRDLCAGSALLPTEPPSQAERTKVDEELSH